jgi:hypothetical protein
MGEECEKFRILYDEELGISADHLVGLLLGW